MYDTDYEALLDAVARRQTPPGRWGRRVWLTGAAMLGVWALCVPAGQGVGLALVAFALLLWGLIPHARPGGAPLPPAAMPPTPDPDTARIKLASKVCFWAGLGGNVSALLWARVPLETELYKRQRAAHPEWPRPRYWLRIVVFLLVLTGSMIWGAFLLSSLSAMYP